MDIEAGIIEVTRPPLELLELPEKWALQKPFGEYNPEIVDKLLRNGRILAMKKYNGHRTHILITAKQEVLIYPRTNKVPINAFIPKLVQHVEALCLPANTLLDGEIYIPNTDGKIESLDRLQAVIACGNAALGAEREKTDAPNVAIFDVPVFGGEDLFLQPYKHRIAKWNLPESKTHLAETIPITSRAQGLKLAEKLGWEGLVLWDLESPHKLNTNGNTKRGGGYKLKLEFEEDFIAYGFKEGTGAGKGLVGTLLIGKLDASGAILPFGEVGSGLSLPEKQLYTGSTQYPFVVAVKHFGLDSKNRVTLPSITKVHQDKLPHEVKI